MGDRAGEGDSLDNIGTAYRRGGRYRAALDYLEQALTVRREVGDRRGEGGTIDGLGIVYARLGEHDRAGQRYRQALDIAREIGDRHLQARTLNGLAETFRRQDRVAEAIADHTSALTIAREVGDRYQEARANEGLGHCLLAVGNRQDARRHWLDALSGYEGLELPEAQEVRDRIAGLADGRPEPPRAGPARPVG